MKKYFYYLFLKLDQYGDNILSRRRKKVGTWFHCKC